MLLKAYQLGIRQSRLFPQLNQWTKRKIQPFIFGQKKKKKRRRLAALLGTPASHIYLLTQISNQHLGK